MRNGFLGSLAALLAGAGLVFAQAETPRQAVAPSPDQPTDAPQSTESPLTAPAPGLLNRLIPSWAGVVGGDVGRIRFGAEGLLWWIKNTRPDPQLVTVGSPALDAELERAFGGEGIDYKMFSGMRFTLDYGFDDLSSSAVEGRFFFVGKRSVDFRDDTSPVVARPFFDVNNRMNSAVVVAFPGLAAGSIAAETSSQMWGGEVNFLKNLLTESVLTPVRFDVLAGFRYFELGEDLSIARVTNFNANIDTTRFTQFGDFAGNSISEFDHFLTRNQFYGVQLGALTKFWIEYMVIDVQTKVAVGTTHEEITIDGGQVRFRPLFGRTTVSRGGLLALPSNIGRFHKEQFAVLPEVTVNIQFPITSHLGFFVGYDLTFLSKVARPADQIDRGLDIAQIPNFPGGPFPGTGLGRPSVPFAQSDFWTMGINLGFEISW
jgi:hypothetical protein